MNTNDKQDKKMLSQENGIIMGMIMGLVLGALLAGGTGNWWWIGVCVGLSMIAGNVAERVGRAK
ncbi:MAG: hypothetical protein GY943_17875 [Chloroflexi bacterium]|nr:hypothetical protein [Chloroflexota bacterium]